MSRKNVRKIYQDDLDLILAGSDYEKYYIEAPTPLSKTKTPKERKTTWPKLVEKFKKFVNGEEILFTESEQQSEDFKLLSLYYKQQQKVSTTKSTILENLRQLDEPLEREFRKDILSCFKENESLSKEEAYVRMQNIFTKYGLLFKAKTCVFVELGVQFEE